MKVAVVILALVAMAVADDYQTTTYATNKKAYNTHHEQPSYNHHGYQPAAYHGHQAEPAYNQYGYNSYRVPAYNVHNRYYQPAYNTHHNTHHSTHHNTHKSTYGYCDSYGYGSYLYNKCNKCAAQSYFTCPTEYYPSGYVAGSETEHKEHHGYEHQNYNSYNPGYHFRKTQMFHFANKYDQSCYWQCDAQGKAIARPCPYGLVFDESVDVCVFPKKY